MSRAKNVEKDVRRFLKARSLVRIHVTWLPCSQSTHDLPQSPEYFSPTKQARDAQPTLRDVVNIFKHILHTVRTFPSYITRLQRVVQIIFIQRGLYKRETSKCSDCAHDCANFFILRHTQKHTNCHLGVQISLTCVDRDHSEQYHVVVCLPCTCSSSSCGVIL